MKLCRYDGGRLGIVEGEEVCDISPALDVIPPRRWPEPFGDALIEHLPEVLQAAEKLLRNAPRKRLSEVKLQSPIANPSKIMAAPANYAAHVDEAKKDAGIHHGVHDLNTEGFATPVDKYGLFLKATSSLVGPAEPVQLHFLGRRNDHEVEVVAVIGKRCKNVLASQAWDIVAGYSLGLDLTVRGGDDRSFRKSADTYAVLGPWFTTANEVTDPENIAFSLSVNDELRQSSNTKHLTASIPRLIEVASACYTLYPGDLLYTGTPEGVGPLEGGDVMTIQSPQLGDMLVTVARASFQSKESVREGCRNLCRGTGVSGCHASK